MKNNTFKHISSSSVYSIFDPTGTKFPQNVDNVQEALSLMAPIENSSTTQAGIVQLATSDEAKAGVDNTKAITPYTLNERLKYPNATVDQYGVIQLATNDEALSGNSDSKGIVPSSLKYTFDWYWEHKTSSENSFGVIKLSTQESAISGTDDTTAMTPLKVKQAIASATSMIPSYTSATESAPGVVQLATVGQTAQGTIRDGFAISPYTLSKLVSSVTQRGIAQASTKAQAITGDDDSVYISAKGFKTYVADTVNVGTVRLTNIVGEAGTGLALSANANVLPTTGGTVNGKLDIIGDASLNGSPLVSAQYVNDSIPIGSIQMWLGDSAPAGDKWELADGGAESKAKRPDLFAVIGYKFGGSGDVFYRPDMRGLFVRGAGRGKYLEDETGFDDKNKPKLGNGVTGGNAGDVQAQAIRRHKHVVPWGENYGTANFGRSSSYGHLGSGKSDYNNPMFFSNEGTEIDSEATRNEYTTLNSKDLINEFESRPWNMSVNYIIKVA